MLPQASAISASLKSPNLQRPSRCYERLQTKTKEFTRLTYTGLVVELEHLKIETRLINATFANAMGEYVTQRL